MAKEAVEAEPGRAGDAKPVLQASALPAHRVRITPVQRTATPGAVGNSEIDLSVQAARTGTECSLCAATGARTLPAETEQIGGYLEPSLSTPHLTRTSAA